MYDFRIAVQGEPRCIEYNPARQLQTQYNEDELVSARISPKYLHLTDGMVKTIVKILEGLAS